MAADHDEGDAMKRNDNIKAKEVRFPLDDAAILAVVSKLATQPAAELSPAETAALAALRRAHPNAGQTNEELGEWLAQMDHQQLQGVVSNTKGVLHEMLFVELENSDGDTVLAAQFEQTNNPDFDIIFSDSDAGHSWAAQLKATDSESYVREWLDEHPNDQILVTSEIANRMGLESSGIANADLTADTNSLVGMLIKANENDDIWDYVPSLGAISVAMVIWSLRARLVTGEITQQQFKWMAAKASGQRAARVLGLSALLSIPGINVLTGMTLLAKVLETSGALKRFDRWASNKTEQMERTREFESAVYGERLAIEGAIKMATEMRETERMLQEKGEQFRRLFEKNHAQFANLFADEVKDDKPPLEYQSPNSCLPVPTGHGEVDELVRERVQQQRCERNECLSEARAFLADQENVSLFREKLDELVGPDAAKMIQQAIYQA